MMRMGRRGFEATRSPAAASLGALGRLPAAINNAPETWQLSAGHFVPAKMTPQIVHPRPDSEMNAYARAARCPHGLEWSIPVAVQGGSWPFYYELVIGPPEMEFIRQTLPSDWLTNGLQGYGVLRWTSPTVGNHPISVRVLDQDGTSTVCEWTLEVIDRANTSYFLFVDATNGSNSNNGSFSSPFQTHAGWVANSGNQDKQIFYRAGTYNINVITLSDGEKFALGSGRAKVHVAFPGESVTLDGQNAAYFDVQSGSGDFCFQDFRFVNPRLASGRKQFIRAGSSQFTRSLVFRSTFVGGDATSANDSNSSALMLSGGAQGNYYAISHNVFDNLDYMDTVLLYYASDGVFEGNRQINGYTANEGWGFFVKGNICERWSCRGNVAIEGLIELPFFFVSEYVGGAGNLRASLEVCWNNIKNTRLKTSAEGAGAVAIGGSDTPVEGNMQNIYVFRNNMRQPYIGFWGVSSGGPYVFEKNVIEHDGTYVDGFLVAGGSNGALLTKTDNATGVAMVDATTNLLTGTPRGTYLGTHGCEVV
jgi:hypothetical protein